MKRRSILLATAPLAALLAFAGVQAWRPIPEPQVAGPVTSTYLFPGPPLSPAWPAYGQAASATGLPGGFSSMVILVSDDCGGTNPTYYTANWGN
ncbi:MAG: hypothetical protein ACP5PW_09125, partial [Candidatus Dormibacteria bacterium]